MPADFVELRGEVPREIVDTLDAKASARGNGANRMTILREVLALWHRQQVHEATLVLRVNRPQRKHGGSGPEGGGNLLDSAG